MTHQIILSSEHLPVRFSKPDQKHCSITRHDFPNRSCKDCGTLRTIMSLQQSFALPQRGSVTTYHYLGSLQSSSKLRTSIQRHATSRSKEIGESPNVRLTIRVYHGRAQQTCYNLSGFDFPSRVQTTSQAVTQSPCSE